MKVYKYHGCNNSFLIIEDNKNEYSVLAQKLCSKTFFDTDGMLVVKNNPLEMVVYNKDGSYAKMCGNGIRCFTDFIHKKDKNNNEYQIKCGNKIYTTKVVSEFPFLCSINLGRAFIVDVNYYHFDKEVKEIYKVDIGNIHLVLFVDSFTEYLPYKDNISLGEYNVNFVRIINQESIEVITYEKGVGFTKSCGTGASASAYLANKIYNLNNKICVNTEGGFLNVEINEEIILVGESKFVNEYEVLDI